MKALADFKKNKLQVLVATGEAISLVSIDEFVKLRDIEKLIKKELPRETVKDFEPTLKLPASSSAGGAPSSSRGRGGRPLAITSGGLGSGIAGPDGMRWGR